MTAKPKLVKPRFLSHLDPYAALWICRIGVGMPNAIDGINAGVYLDEIRAIVGISPAEGKFSKVELRALLKVRLFELELERPTFKSTLARNVSMFAELLGLDKLEQDILLFSAMAQRHPYLSEFMDGIRTTSVDAIARLLAAALKVTEAAVAKALRIDGELFASRMVTLESGYTTNGFKLEFSNTLLTALFSEADDLKMLMSSFVESATPATLAEADFTHLAQEVALLKSYLANASNSTKTNSKAANQAITGTNILIYGQAGTGKTEFVKYLAASLNKQLYQVRDSNDQGTPINGVERLAFFQLTQRFLHKSNALILFDEIEDVFPDTNNSGLEALFSRRAVVGKMFINRILENNPVPTIWVSNQVDHIDKAYLRRFDFSMEIGVPPVSVRRGILQNYLQPYKISTSTIEHLSQQELLSPAQIEKAAKVLKLSADKTGVKTSSNADDKVGIKADSKHATNEEKLMLIIDNSMALLSQDKIDASFNLAECSYQLDFLNPDCDVKHLVAQLKQKPDATGALCFYGAPGTGKTALAHFIARELELPLMARKASDIISPYVGETEQKIALMFKKAQEDNALLLLDEADSFLSERKSARNSWEVTAVNEMLTQMETFKGLFICSTNLMQKLDEASLRRFALKIRFDYLKPNQRMQLFMAQLQAQAHVQKITPELEFECRAALNQLHNLTPGDFAVVRRQAMLLSATLTAPELLNRLKQECRAKSDSNSRPIGFMQSH